MKLHIERRDRGPYTLLGRTLCGTDKAKLGAAVRSTPFTTIPALATCERCRTIHERTS